MPLESWIPRTRTRVKSRWHELRRRREQAVNLFDHHIFGIEQPQDPDQFVGHYTNVAGLEGIAGSKALRLGRLAAMNDPREYRQRRFSVMGAGLDRQELESISASLNAARANTRVASFTRDSIDGEPTTLSRTDARAYARQSTWSHYGDRHRGACIIFEKAHLMTSLRSTFGPNAVGDKITYVAGVESGFDTTVDPAELQRLGRGEYVQEHERTNVQLSLFTKNHDWEIEREWRIVVRGHDQSNEAFVPLTSSVWPVAGVVLGEDFSTSDLAIARLFAETFRITSSVVSTRLYRGVLDLVPVCTSEAVWRFYTDEELKTLGHTNIR